MNECRSWVYEPRRSKIGSSKEIVEESKYIKVMYSVANLTIYLRLFTENVDITKNICVFQVSA